MPEDVIPAIGQCPENYFTGNSQIVTGELPALLNQIANAERMRHKETITPSDSQIQPGLGPIPIVFGSVMGLQYDQPATDKAFRTMKIDECFVDNASFHIHWTKSGNGDELGSTVRWRVRYTIFDGEDEIALVTPTELLLNDTYEDDGTTTRITYRTADIPAPGLIAGYYIGACGDIDTAGTNLSDPVLLSADLIYNERINR